MRRLPAVLLVAAGISATVLGGPAARAPAAPSFLDDRPIAVDLDEAQVGDKWGTVEVAVSIATADAVGLEPVLSPPSLAIDPPSDAPRPVSATTTVLAFTLVLSRAEVASGALVLIGPAGVVARRPVRVLHGLSDVSPPKALTTHGLRTHPFGGAVRVRPIDLPAPDVSEAKVVGRLVSGGRSAEVLQSTQGLSFAGIDQAGRYEGSADLRLGTDGDKTAVQVLVRDQIVWPLLALCAGLGIVSALDVGRRRDRPARCWPSCCAAWWSERARTSVALT